MKWLVERSQSDYSNSGRLVETIRNHGFECQECLYVPIQGGVIDYKTRQPIESFVKTSECGLAFGTINFARWNLRYSSWTPGMWLDFDVMRCRSYYAHLGPYLLNSPYAMMPLAEIPRQQEWIYNVFGKSELAERQVFIRPDDNAKSFCGEVVHAAQIKEWYDYATTYEGGPETLAVVSSKRLIFREWRLVVVDGNVVTGSQYKKNGEVEIEKGWDEHAASFVEDALFMSRYKPYPMFCVDVCSTPQGYRIVEIGSINTCGLYDCDLDVIVDEAARYAQIDWDSLQT